MGLGWGYAVSAEPAIFLYVLLPGLVECMKIKLHLLRSSWLSDASAAPSIQKQTVPVFFQETLVPRTASVPSPSHSLHWPSLSLTN